MRIKEFVGDHIIFNFDTDGFIIPYRYRMYNVHGHTIMVMKYETNCILYLQLTDKEVTFMLIFDHNVRPCLDSSFTQSHSLNISH